VAQPAAAPRRRARPDGHVPQELVIRASDVILVTGFEPFGGERVNPSWEICTRLPHTIAGRRVETCRVPCEFARAVDVVAAAIGRHRPSLVICLGQAGGRARISVERVAINVDDARAPDNAGEQPIDAAITPDGPPAYFATLPVKAMVAAIRRAGVPAELSNSAGTYVCNHLMYGVLDHVASMGLGARAGFVHVPYSEEQVVDRPDVPGMSIESMAKGIEAAIRATCENQVDIAVSEGTIS
jgi:pyroglutamyl-peptidase